MTSPRREFPPQVRARRAHPAVRLPLTLGAHVSSGYAVSSHDPAVVAEGVVPLREATRLEAQRSGGGVVVKHLHRLDGQRAAQVHGKDDEGSGPLLEQVALHLAQLRRLFDIVLASEESDRPPRFPVADAVDVIPVDLMWQRLSLVKHWPLLVHQNDILDFRRIQHLGEEHSHVPKATAQIHDVGSFVRVRGDADLVQLHPRVENHGRDLVQLLGDTA
mmetsp:Transcript_31123/g.77932  ORF Transcript_31123/g.77932 Transcript_31123/m.77932 type:complete len:218 (-) Transcript_31123:280-933(-)